MKRTQLHHFGDGVILILSPRKMVLGALVTSELEDLVFNNTLVELGDDV